MKKNILYFLLACLLFTPKIGLAQKQFKTNLLNFNSGLPSDYVQNIVKKDNKLYISTQRGLSFYDGYRFQNHKNIKTNIYNLFVKNEIIYFYDSLLKYRLKFFYSFHLIVDKYLYS